MQETSFETSKLAFHLKKMEPLLSQDHEKNYNLLEEGKIALGMLEYGRKRFDKRKAAIIDKLGEMFKLGEYPRVVRQVVVSLAKGFREIHSSKHRFLPLGVLFVIFPHIITGIVFEEPSVFLKVVGFLKVTLQWLLFGGDYPTVIFGYEKGRILFRHAQLCWHCPLSFNFYIRWDGFDIARL